MFKGSHKGTVEEPFSKSAGLPKYMSREKNLEVEYVITYSQTGKKLVREDRNE